MLAKIVTRPAPKKLQAVEENLERRICKGKEALSDLARNSTVRSLAIANKAREEIRRNLDTIDMLLLEEVLDDFERHMEWSDDGDATSDVEQLLLCAGDIVAQREKLFKLTKKSPDHPLPKIADEVAAAVEQLIAEVIGLADDRERDDIEPRLNLVRQGRSAKELLRELRDPPTPSPFASSRRAESALEAPAPARATAPTSVYSAPPSPNGQLKKPVPQAEPPRARIVYRPAEKPAPLPPLAPNAPLPEFLKHCTSPAETFGLETEEETQRRAVLQKQLDQYLSERVFVRYGPAALHRHLTRLALPYASDRKEWIQWMDPTHPRYTHEENVAKQFPDWMNHMNIASIGELRAMLNKGASENSVRALFLAMEHPACEHSQRFSMFVWSLMEHKKHTVATLDRWLRDRQAIDRRA